MCRMENFGYEVVETARLIRREFNRRAAELGTTREQWRVLAILNRHGDGPRQIDLAETLEVEPITLCRMIDRLEGLQLVERRRDENDRRAWRIHLTEKAQPVIEQLKTLARDFSRDILAGLDADEVAVTAKTLDRVCGNLSAMEDAERARS
jgi:MarR family transcriptional regulator, transcriptional regulator for hemolysin